MKTETPSSLPGTGFILDRLWHAYVTADDRRGSTFRYLIATVVTFALVWQNRSASFRLPIINAEVQVHVALTLAPLFLAIMTARYLYLCAHSLISYMVYLEYYEKQYRQDLARLSISFPILFGSFRRRDLTESFNIYLFPMGSSAEWDATISPWVNWPVMLLGNAAAVLSLAVPVVAYVVNVAWLAINISGQEHIGIAVLILCFYVFLGILLLLSPLYFYYRSKPARKVFFERVMV